MSVKHTAGSVVAALLFFSCAVVWANPTKPRMAACQDQVRPRKSTVGRQVVVIEPGLICFGGGIDKTSAKALISAIKRTPPGQPLTLVVEGSDGGDLASGLDIAEALSVRDSTVIASGVCASSCANYLWLMAHHRIIADGAPLIFHGGATLALLPEMDEQIEALAKTHPDINAEKFKLKERAQLENWVHRQDALLANVGVKPDFFEFFNHLNSRRTLAFDSNDCKANPNAKYVVFSPEYLKSKGVKIEINEGPRTATEMHTALKRISAKASQETCFWN